MPIHKIDEQYAKELNDIQKKFEDQTEQLRKTHFTDKIAIMKLKERHATINKIRKIAEDIEIQKKSVEQTFQLCLTEMICPWCGGELIDDLSCPDCKRHYKKPIIEEKKDEVKP